MRCSKASAKKSTSWWGGKNMFRFVKNEQTLVVTNCDHFQILKSLFNWAFPICDALRHELNLPHYFLNSWRTAPRIGMNALKNASQRYVLFFQLVTHCVTNWDGIFCPERASRLSVGRSPTLALDRILSPERAARMMRTPLQGLLFTHSFEGLRPSLRRLALSGLKKIIFQSSLRSQIATFKAVLKTPKEFFKIKAFQIHLAFISVLIYLVCHA